MDIELLYFLNSFAGKSELFDTIIIFLAEYLGYFLVGLFFLFLYFSPYSREKKLYIFLMSGITVIISRLVITELIRFLYYRPRPFLEHQEVFELLQKNSSSFPSGHSAFFFALATMLFFYNKKLGSLFFISALLMNIARVTAGIHYPSDILGGMIIGIITSLFLFYFSKKLKPRP